MLSSSYLLVNKTEKGNANLHAQVMQAEESRLQQNEAGGEEEPKAQGQVVSLTPLWSMERVKGCNDATRKLRLHRFGNLL